MNEPPVNLIPSELSGLLLFGYTLYIKDPVFILGQGFGVFVYLRNLYFIKREQRAGAASA